MPAQFKIGDRVKWAYARATANQFNFSTRTGKITRLDPEGKYVYARQNGKKADVCLKAADVVPIDQPSPVNEIFKAITV